MTRLFISHASADRQFVDEELKGLLNALGFDFWYSTENIETGEQWVQSVKSGLEASQWFILVMSPDACKSDWVKDEIAWAINYRPNRIVPLFASACNPIDLHLRLPRIQSIDFTKNLKKAREKLIKVLVKKEYIRGSLTEAVNTLIKCPSKEILTVIKTEKEGSSSRTTLVGANERANDFFARRKGMSIVGKGISELFETLLPWMEREDFNRFEKDQERMQHLINKGEEIYAKVPMKINHNHPIESFRGRSFLPISIAYSGPNLVETKMVEYFLIFYLDLEDICDAISFVTKGIKT